MGASDEPQPNVHPRSQRTQNNVIPNSSFLIERSCHTSPKLTGRPARLHKSSERTCLTPTIKALLTSAETPPASSPAFLATTQQRRQRMEAARAQHGGSHVPCHLRFIADLPRHSGCPTQDVWRQN